MFIPISPYGPYRRTEWFPPKFPGMFSYRSQAAEMWSRFLWHFQVYLVQDLPLASVTSVTGGSGFGTNTGVIAMLGGIAGQVNNEKSFSGNPRLVGNVWKCQILVNHLNILELVWMVPLNQALYSSLFLIFSDHFFMNSLKRLHCCGAILKKEILYHWVFGELRTIQTLIANFLG
jgi:hypothetical protein